MHFILEAVKSEHVAMSYILVFCFVLFCINTITIFDLLKLASTKSGGYLLYLK